MSKELLEEIVKSFDENVLSINKLISDSHFDYTSEKILEVFWKNKHNKKFIKNLYIIWFGKNKDQILDELDYNHLFEDFLPYMIRTVKRQNNPQMHLTRHDPLDLLTLCTGYIGGYDYADKISDFDEKICRYFNQKLSTGEWHSETPNFLDDPVYDFDHFEDTIHPGSFFISAINLASRLKHIDNLSFYMDHSAEFKNRIDAAYCSCRQHINLKSPLMENLFEKKDFLDLVNWMFDRPFFLDMDLSYYDTDAKKAFAKKQRLKQFFEDFSPDEIPFQDKDIPVESTHKSYRLEVKLIDKSNLLIFCKLVPDYSTLLNIRKNSLELGKWLPEIPAHLKDSDTKKFGNFYFILNEFIEGKTADEVIFKGDIDIIDNILDKLALIHAVKQETGSEKFNKGDYSSKLQKRFISLGLDHDLLSNLFGSYHVVDSDLSDAICRFYKDSIPFNWMIQGKQAIPIDLEKNQLFPPQIDLAGLLESTDSLDRIEKYAKIDKYIERYNHHVSMHNPEREMITDKEKFIDIYLNAAIDKSLNMRFIFRDKNKEYGLIYLNNAIECAEILASKDYKDHKEEYQEIAYSIRSIRDSWN